MPRLINIGTHVDDGKPFKADLDIVLKDGIDKLSQRQQVVVSEIGNLATLVKRAGTTLANGASKNIRDVQILDAGHRSAVANPPARSAVSKQERDLVETIPAVTQRMLAALRQGEAMQLSSMPFKNVAVIAGVSPTSGTTSNRRSFLATNGFITVNGKNVSLTDKGRAYPIDVEMPPTDREGLLQYWKREIGTEKIAIMLETIVRNGPVSNDELRAAAGMENSGTFSNYRSALIGRGLIMKQGDGTYVASEVFG